MEGPELVVLVPRSWPPGEEGHKSIEKEVFPVVLLQRLNGEKSKINQKLLLFVVPNVNVVVVILVIKVRFLDVKMSVVTCSVKRRRV